MAAYAMYKGARYTLKENGLPDGYALYWFFPEGKKKEDAKKYIYTKFQQRGLSCKTQKWQQAVDFVLALRRAAQEREGRAKPSNLTIKQLLDHYVVHLERKNAARGDYEPQTAKNTKYVVESSLTFFHGIKADKLQHMPELLTEYREKRTKELMEKKGKAAADVQYTIDHEISMVRSAYNRAVKDRKIHRSVVPVFEIDKKNALRGARHGTFSAEQITTLEKSLPEPVNLMLSFCLISGVRKKESTFIHRTQVNWAEQTVILKDVETKSDKERIVPFSKKLLPSLLAWEERTRREYPKAEYLFHVGGQRITEPQVDDAFNETCQELGWHKPKLDGDGNVRRGKNRSILWDRSPTWHDSRRNATTDGGALPGVKDLDQRRVLGQNEQTQDRYNQNESAKTLRDAINRRDDMEAGLTPAVAVPPPAPTQEQTVEDKLSRLKSMFDRGLIPEQIYQAKLAEIISAF